MTWFTDIFTAHSALQAVVVLSLIATVGIGLGKIRFLGISLGSAFIFFVGIVAATALESLPLKQAGQFALRGGDIAQIYGVSSKVDQVVSLRGNVAQVRPPRPEYRGVAPREPERQHKQREHTQCPRPAFCTRTRHGAASLSAPP